jgi:hypothetical protein
MGDRERGGQRVTLDLQVRLDHEDFRVREEIRANKGPSVNI